MSDPFETTNGKLRPHWDALRASIIPALDAKASDTTLDVLPSPSQQIAIFNGSAARRANRLRGAPVPVVPLCSVSARGEAWLGYREVWSQISRTKCRFESADLTLFFAAESSEAFQQVLRAEWIGFTEDGAGEWIQRPTNAGHPHWHLDIIESMRQDDELSSAISLLRESEPREFGIRPASVSVTSFNFGRMHLASGARPWIDNIIAHGPKALKDIRNWVAATVRSLRSEIGRL